MVTFQDVAVGPENMVGKEGEGFKGTCSLSAIPDICSRHEGL